MRLTQEQLAAQSGLTVATVNRWEHGRAVAQSLAMKHLKEFVARHDSLVRTPACCGVW